MDPLSALAVATAAFQLGETCLNIAKLIKNVHRSVGNIFDEFRAFRREVETLQDVSESVGRTTKAIDEVKSNLSKEDQVAMEKLTSGILEVIRGCEPQLAELDIILEKYAVREGLNDPSRLDSLKTVFGSHKDKDRISDLRQRLKSVQDQLLAYQSALHILHLLATHKSTSSSIGNVSEQIKQLSAQLEQRKMTLGTKQHTIDSVLTSVKLNRYFWVPRPMEALFTGRERLLKELRLAFDPFKESVVQKRFVIHGFPGSGKTEFCYRFANLYRESFWGVFVIDASSHDHAVNSFQRAIQYATRKHDLRDFRLMKQWFADQEQPWLLIIDNADDPRLEIETYFPPGNRGCVLINTRNPSLRIYGNVGQRFYHFEGLEEDEAQTLLFKAANEPSPYSIQAVKAAPKISKELYCLPLALVFAGKVIRDKLSTWELYLDWYKEIRERYSDKVRGSVTSDDGGSSYKIIPTFEPLLERLELSTDSNDTQSLELIYMLSYFHHSNISLDLLTRVVKNAHLSDFIIEDEELSSTNQNQRFVKSSTHGYHTWSLNHLGRFFNGKSAIPDIFRNTIPSTGSSNKTSIHAVDLSTHGLRKLLKYLEDLGLIRGGGEAKSYSIHPLVHSWVKSRLLKPWRRAVWCEAANRALADSIVLDSQTLSAGGAEHINFDAQQALPHIDYARGCKQDIDRELGERRISAGRLGRSALRYTKLHPLTQRDHIIQSVKFSIVYAQCGRYRHAYALQREAREHMVSNYGMNDEYSIHTTLALAGIQRFVGNNFQGFDLQQEVVKACKVLYGADHTHTLWMLAFLGLFAYQESRLTEAREYVEIASAGFRDRVTANSKSAEIRQRYQTQVMRMQSLLAAIQGKFFKFQEAIDLSEEALQFLEQHSSEYKEIAGARESLIWIYYWSDGEHQERLYQVAVSFHQAEEQNHGAHHPLTLWAVLQVCRALWCLKRYEEGLTMIEELLVLAAETIGKDHYGFLMGEMLRAAMLRDMGSYEEALQPLLRCKQMFAQMSRHFDHIDTLLHLMRLYEAQKKHTEAIATAMTVKGVVEVVFGKDSGKSHPLYRRMNEKIRQLQPMTSSEYEVQPNSTMHVSDQELRKRRDASTNETSST